MWLRFSQWVDTDVPSACHTWGIQASVHTLEERARVLKREAVAATQACAHAKDQVDLVKAKHRATEAAVAKLRSNEAEARKTLEQLGRRVQALRLSIEVCGRAPKPLQPLYYTVYARAGAHEVA